MSSEHKRVGGAVAYRKKPRPLHFASKCDSIRGAASLPTVPCREYELSGAADVTSLAVRCGGRCYGNRAIEPEGPAQHPEKFYSSKISVWQ